MFWHAFIDVGLVYDLGNVLGHVVDQGRIRSWDLSAVYCVCRAIFDEEGEEVGDAMEKEDDDKGDGDEKDGEPSTHVGRCNCRL